MTKVKATTAITTKTSPIFLLIIVFIIGIFAAIFYPSSLFIMKEVQAQTAVSFPCEVTVDTITGVRETPESIAYDPVNKRMYEVNHFDNTVSVIDTISNDVIAGPIPVGTFPEDIAYDSVNKRMYVTNFIDGTVSVIDTNTNTVIAKPIKVEDSPQGMEGIAYDPVNKRMYVNVFDNFVVNNTIFGNSTVSVIDTTTNTVNDTIPADSPFGIAYDPVNKRMYVANVGDTVSVIDTTTNTVNDTIPVGDFPQHIAYDPVNERIYVTNLNNHTVSVIDTNTNTVIGKQIQVGDGPSGIAYDPVNERMYVTNRFDDTVSVINIADII